MGKRSGWKRNLQVGEICKWVKRGKEVGENEIYKLVKSKWVKQEKEVGENEIFK